MVEQRQGLRPSSGGAFGEIWPDSSGPPSPAPSPQVVNPFAGPVRGSRSVGNMSLADRCINGNQLGIPAVGRGMGPIRLLILALVGLGTAACAASGTSPPQALDSGVQGVTMVGPTCPVQQETACPDQPLASANLTVTRQGSATTVATGRSDADGHFRIPLAPGAYILRPANPSGDAVPPSAPARPFVVHPHAYTELTVKFDSGIR
jgi:hypothetical protein